MISVIERQAAGPEPRMVLDHPALTRLLPALSFPALLKSFGGGEFAIFDELSAPGALFASSPGGEQVRQAYHQQDDRQSSDKKQKHWSLGLVQPRGIDHGRTGFWARRRRRGHKVWSLHGSDRCSGMNPVVVLLRDRQQTANGDAADDQQEECDNAQSRHGEDHAQQEQTNYEMHFKSPGVGRWPTQLASGQHIE